jgi:hypothetical protein
MPKNACGGKDGRADPCIRDAYSRLHHLNRLLGWAPVDGMHLNYTAN